MRIDLNVAGGHGELEYKIIRGAELRVKLEEIRATRMVEVIR